jgi:hypothetical protein
MNLFGLDKSEPKRQRKTRKSRKWLTYVKREAETPPNLTQMLDNPILKAAVLCRDNHFTLKISDFTADTLEGMAFIQYMLSIIEAVRKQNPPVLDELQQEVIQEGTQIIENHSHRRRSAAINEVTPEKTAPLLDESEPPPYIRPLMKPKVRWQPLKKPIGTVVPPESSPFNREFLELIKKVKEGLESAAQAQGVVSQVNCSLSGQNSQANLPGKFSG